MFYEYQKNVNSEKLSREINLSSISSFFEGVTFNGVIVKVVFSKELTELEKQILDDLMNKHSPIDSDLEMRISISDREKFGDQVIEEFKLKNLKEGIKWFQAIHLHERIKNWKVNLPAEVGGGEAFVDIFNMVLSGDIETASLALLYGENDDMTQGKHWVTNERRMWLLNRMREWLGWPTV